MKNCEEEEKRTQSPGWALLHMYTLVLSIFPPLRLLSTPLLPIFLCLLALQLQTTWEKAAAIYIFKNGSGMKVIGAAESVNKCNTRRKKEEEKKKERRCDDTWNVLAEILDALERRCSDVCC